MSSPYPMENGLPPAAAEEQAASGSGDVPMMDATQTRRADELARKDRTLAEFMLMLDEYEPLIPNEVTDYYLQRVGFECEDIRLKRLLSLAAQKFVSDIAADAFQHARLRTNAAPGSRARAAATTDKTAAGAAAGGTTGGASTSAATNPAKDKSKTVLTMEDLSAALNEYGVTARKPEFFL